jgi:hypothetical protein
LSAKLRRSNVDASAGAVEEVAGASSGAANTGAGVRIILRADSGFTWESLLGLLALPLFKDRIAGLLAIDGPSRTASPCVRPRPQPAAGRSYRHQARPDAVF